jgi:hypothetical protein
MPNDSRHGGDCRRMADIGLLDVFAEVSVVRPVGVVSTPGSWPGRGPL